MGFIQRAKQKRADAEQARQQMVSGAKERAAGTPVFDASMQPVLGDAAQAQTYTAQYQTPQQSAQSILDMRKALGFGSPDDQMRAKREAVMDSLNRESYMGALRDQQQLAQQGQSTGARSQALSVLRDTELAGKQSQAEAGIQAQMDAIREAIMGQALSEGRAKSQFDADVARAKTQGEQFNVGNQLQREAQRVDLADQRRLNEIRSMLTKQGLESQADALDWQSKEDQIFRFTDILGPLMQSGTALGAAGISTMG